MDYKYFLRERALEKNRLIKSLVPRFILILRKQIQYRLRYPSALITASSRIENTAVIGEHCIINETDIGPNVIIGAFTTTGPNTRMYGRGEITVGKYCSIAPDCVILSENHNTDRASTYPHERIFLGREEKYMEHSCGKIFIGNDVWIGQRCTILAGANIGHGCIVAAGAVVPRGNYPSYSVIGGVPAKVIKIRFDAATVEMLLTLQWWNKSPEDVFGSMMDFLHKDFSVFAPQKISKNA